MATSLEGVEPFGDMAEAGFALFVKRFVEDAHALGDRMQEAWQQDAFGHIDAPLRAVALRD